MILRFFIFLILFVSTSYAELITVNQSGTADYADLQLAINAAHDDDVIWIQGGIYPKISIDKPLTLVGGPRPLIEADDYNGSYYQDHVINALGPGYGKLVFANIATGGSTNGLYTASQSAVRVNGFDQFHVVESEIKAPQWDFLLGGAQGNYAISTSVPYVFIQSSYIEAQHAATDSCLSGGTAGLPAISSSGATTVVMDSVIKGGDGSDYCQYGEPPFPMPCPCNSGIGIAGAALTANNLIYSNSEFVPGKGAQIGFYDELTEWQAWGKQNDAKMFEASSVEYLSNRLYADSPFVLASSWGLNIKSSSTTQSDALIGSFGSPGALQIPQGLKFLDTSNLFYNQTISGQANHIDWIVSDVEIGDQLFAQVYDGKAGKLTRPIQLVVLP
ncbi:MAG: hypothetical protein H6619_02590 [Deltaproteobacteria bacterium]|nr:hypothetical protein [Deltaproteobacteria bacterium]